MKRNTEELEIIARNRQTPWQARYFGEPHVASLVGYISELRRTFPTCLGLNIIYCKRLFRKYIDPKHPVGLARPNRSVNFPTTSGNCPKMEPCRKVHNSHQNRVFDLKKYFYNGLRPYLKSLGRDFRILPGNPIFQLRNGVYGKFTEAVSTILEAT